MGREFGSSPSWVNVELQRAYRALRQAAWEVRGHKWWLAGDSGGRRARQEVRQREGHVREVLGHLRSDEGDPQPEPRSRSTLDR